MKDIFLAAARNIPSYFFLKFNNMNPIIPYYHVVSNNEILHIKHLYNFKNVQDFINDLEYFQRIFKPISLFDLLGHVKSGISLPKNAILFRFDDGLREIHDVIAPILINRGIPAVIFINSNFIDNKELCYQHKASIVVECVNGNQSSGIERKIKKLLQENELEFNNVQQAILSIQYQNKYLIDEIAQFFNVDFVEYLYQEEPYLTSLQINNLLNNGFAIGAHSIDHPYYSSISLDDQLYQSIESIKVIREKFSLSYGTFAFPHSDYYICKDFFNQFYNSGLIDVSFGNCGIIKDSIYRHFQRFSCEKPLVHAKKIVGMNIAKKLIRKIKKSDKLNRDNHIK